MCELSHSKIDFLWWTVLRVLIYVWIILTATTVTPSVESGGKDKHEQLGNLIIQMESIKKNQKEMLEIKNKYQNLVNTGY